MSIVHMVACGMIDCEDRRTFGAQQFRHIRREVREELRGKGLRLTGTDGFYKLLKRTHKAGKRTKYKVCFDGSFKNACKAATAIITPSDLENL